MVYDMPRTVSAGAALEPVFNAPGKRGRKHVDDLRSEPHGTRLMRACLSPDIEA